MGKVSPCSFTFARLSFGSPLLIITTSSSGCSRWNFSGAAPACGTGRSAGWRKPATRGDHGGPPDRGRRGRPAVGARNSGAGVPAFKPSRLILLRTNECSLKRSARPSRSHPPAHRGPDHSAFWFLLLLSRSHRQPRPPHPSPARSQSSVRTDQVAARGPPACRPSPLRFLLQQHRARKLVVPNNSRLASVSPLLTTRTSGRADGTHFCFLPFLSVAAPGRSNSRRRD